MKYTKHIIVTFIALLITGGVVYGTTISPSTQDSTIGNLFDTVNHVISHLEDSTSTLSSIIDAATTTGNILVATSSNGWFALPVGTNGQVLTVSSSDANRVGVAWDTLSTNVTINGEVAGTWTFSTSTVFSGNLHARISTSSDTLTFQPAWGFTPTNGQLLIGNGVDFSLGTLTAGTQMSILNASGSITVTNEGVRTLTAGTQISVSSATGTVTVTNEGVRTLTAGTQISVSSATGTVTVTNEGVRTLTAGSGITITSATGTPTIAVSSTRLFAITVPSPTSTAGDYTTNNVMLGSFIAPVTLNTITCVNTPSSTANSVTFQIVHSTNNSLNGDAVFSSAQVCSSATSTQNFVTFSDATIASNETLTLRFTAASSTQVSISGFGTKD